MDNKSLKRFYYITGILCVIPTIYFIVRIIVGLTSERVLPDFWNTLNYVAVAFYGLALLMLIGFIVFSSNKSKNLDKKQKAVIEDNENLKKYQSKRK